MSQVVQLMKAGNISEELLVSTWQAWLPGVSVLEKAMKDGEAQEDVIERLIKGDWDVHGHVARVEKEDYDKDILDRAGVWKGIGAFTKDFGAHVDWEHMYPKEKDPKWLIGKGMDVHDVKGIPALTTRLYKSSDIAANVFRRSVEGASFGYSIWGTGVRDKKNPKRVAANEIRMVTLAASPKGFADTRVQVGKPDSSLYAVAKAMVYDCSEGGHLCRWVPMSGQQLEKSLTTGAGIVQAGEQGGAALRRQHMGAPPKHDHHDCGCGCKGDKKKCKKRPNQNEQADFEPIGKALTDILVAQHIPNAERIAQALVKAGVWR